MFDYGNGRNSEKFADILLEERIKSTTFAQLSRNPYSRHQIIRQNALAAASL
jgi:fido (protein-threonine AMPylation protein)